MNGDILQGYPSEAIDCYWLPGTTIAYCRFPWKSGSNITLILRTSIKHVHFNPAFEAQDEERSRRRLDRQEEKKVGLCASVRSKNR
jgi:hypothetical protein